MSSSVVRSDDGRKSGSVGGDGANAADGGDGGKVGDGADGSVGGDGAVGSGSGVRRLSWRVWIGS
jgi:hypothetical protein